MSKFIALPVGQGDAFYLEDGNFSVLVDGGRSRLALPCMFRKHTGRDGVDVLVCTHNDADHANGLIGFLRNGLRCGEVWLPGRWLSVLPDALKPFGEVFEILAENVAALSEKQLAGLERKADVSPLEAYAESVESPRDEVDADSAPDSDGWPELCIEWLERAEPWDSPYEMLFRDREFWRYFPYWHNPRLSPAGIHLLWSAIDAASRIRDIAIAAFHWGVPVRWFKYDPLAPSGGNRYLVPVNAKKIATVRPCPKSCRMLAYLALTVTNRESLVFWSPRTDARPGVLFTADSDLSGVKPPGGLDGAIVTAPHHGSETNKLAYGVVGSAVRWVRSDGRYKSRPGSTYLLQKQRICTLCRSNTGGSKTKQAVRLYSRGGAWVRNRVSFGCSCQ